MLNFILHSNEFPVLPLKKGTNQDILAMKLEAQNFF